VLAHPGVETWVPSRDTPGRWDLTLAMPPVPLALAAAAEPWEAGRPDRPNLWAALGPEARGHWLGLALDHRDRDAPDRPAGGVWHLDGSHVTDTNGLFCALGEAANGPGGYYGRCWNGFADALGGGFGAGRPAAIVWHGHGVARRCLGTRPLRFPPPAFGEVVAILEAEGIEVVLA
jgi:hypothetical protein